MRFLLVGLSLVSSTTLHAATLVYSDRSVFESKLVTSIVDDYENPGYVFRQSDAAMTAVLNETAYMSTAFSNHNLIFGGTNQKYCAGCNGSYQMDFTSTSVSSTNGVGGVGFEYFNDGNALTGEFIPFGALVGFGDGTDQFYSLDFAPHQDTLSAFFGITSSKQIATIHIGLANGQSSSSGNFGQDNLTIGSIPEPSSVILFGLGLLGLWQRRRDVSATGGRGRITKTIHFHMPSRPPY